MKDDRYHHHETREDLGFKGPIKRIDQQKYYARLSNGKIVQCEKFFSFHNDDVFICVFDENGKLIEKTNYSYDESSTINLYNEKGEMLQSRHFSKGGTQTSITLHEYNENSDITKEAFFPLKKESGSTTVFTYDDKGFLVEIQQLDFENKVMSSHYYKNDELGNHIEDKTLKADGSIAYWNLNKYNEYGHSIETTSLNEDGSVKSVSETNRLYDEDGKYLGFPGNMIPLEAKIEYSDLEFDHFGNWVCRIGNYNSVPAIMLLRNISYHSDNEEDVIQSDNPKQIEFNVQKTNIPTTEKENMENITPPLKPMLEYKELEESHAKWLAEACTVEHFPAFRYYAILNNNLPSATVYRGQDVEIGSLLGELQKEMGAKIVHTHGFHYLDENTSYMNNCTLQFPNKKYLLQINQISSAYDSQYLVPEFFERHNPHWNGAISIGYLTLFHPTNESGLRDERFEEELHNYIKLCSLEKVPDIPEIRIVEVNSANDYALKTYPVNDDFLIKNLDLHYGYGFETFHNKLIDRFKHETKGLVLFHGEPGTGKTYYIRHLLRHMAQNNKIVLYIPPNMVERLIDPAFFTFLSSQISQFSEEHKFCVLLVEDAEPLLASRQNEGRVLGVSNLLNLTDGLLNDLMKLQIICTFNVKIEELDAALLRPGRLIARKEFKAMSMLDANRLAQQLGIKHHFSAPANIAEVYALLKNKDTLTHTNLEEEEF
ncbi:MAG: AAA family ATPase [Bacteroidota bacterium]